MHPETATTVKRFVTFAACFIFASGSFVTLPSPAQAKVKPDLDKNAVKEKIIDLLKDKVDVCLSTPRHPDKAINVKLPAVLAQILLKREGVPGPCRCDDGLVSHADQCDDGNTANNDGCSSTCAVEYCGDGGQLHR